MNNITTLPDSLKNMNLFDKTRNIISRVSTITSSAKSIIEEKIRYKSQYQKVVDFHKCAGHPFFDTIQHDYTIEKPERVKFRVELIKEELAELIDAVKDNNIKEIVDALSDILYVTYGMGAELGIDLDKSFDIVHDTNMTKLCKTEHEAIDTVKWYKESESRYDSPSYRKSLDGEYWIVYNKSNDKILKSNQYIAANFESLL